MGRTRQLKPNFFKNDTLCECQPLARLLFAGLWCLADASGRLEYRPVRIKAEVLPYDDCSIPDMMDELEARGFVHRYSAGTMTIILIPKFLDHQRPHPKEPSETFPPEDSSTREAVYEKPQKEISRNLKVRPSPENKFPEMYDCASYPLILKSFNPLILKDTEQDPQDPSSTCRKRQSRTVDAIGWSVDAGWQGITDADRAGWVIAYPAAVQATELAKASEWLRANPSKAKRKNWRRFLTTWLNRCQEGGGTKRGYSGTSGLNGPERPCKPFSGAIADAHRAAMARLAQEQAARDEEDRRSRLEASLLTTEKGDS